MYSMLQAAGLDLSGRWLRSKYSCEEGGGLLLGRSLDTRDLRGGGGACKKVGEKD